MTIDTTLSRRDSIRICVIIKPVHALGHVVSHASYTLGLDTDSNEVSNGITP